MEIISSKRFILLALATSSLLTSNIFCTDELMMPHFHSKENYGKYSEPGETPKGEKERSINFQELKDWGPKNVIKMSTAMANKMPHSAANLPLRFGRTMREERSPGAATNMEARVLSHVPNLPQRFGRMTTRGRSIPKTLSHLLLMLRSLHEPPAGELLYCMTRQHLETQGPDQQQPRRRAFKETDDAERKQEK
uniref:Pro-FMRFamide-related neuropeptide VF n=1 Tax=Nannospalax galili TaxID=1026970 RepID=A0A8C6RZZ7_NANGA